MHIPIKSTIILRLKLEDIDRHLLLVKSLLLH